MFGVSKPGDDNTAHLDFQTARIPRVLFEAPVKRLVPYVPRAWMSPSLVLQGTPGSSYFIDQESALRCALLPAHKAPGARLSRSHARDSVTGFRLCRRDC